MTHATPDDLDARAADLERQARANRAIQMPSHTQRANARTLRALAAEARQYEEIRMSTKDNVIQFPAPQNRRLRINPDGMRAVKALAMVLGESDADYALRIVTAYVWGVMQGKEITIDASSVRVALPDDHDATKPFPLTIRRDFENPNCWATGDGKRVFNTREWAEKSMELDSPEYREKSRLRMEYSRLVKAEPIAGTDWVFCDGYGHNEGYFYSVDELREHCECDDIPVPAWCHATTEQAFRFDVFDALDNYLNDQHHEEAHDQVKGWDELESFWKAWQAKQTLKSCYPDYSKIVVIDDAAYLAEVAEAKAWLAEHVPS